ncbi:MAG: ABC transporter permease [Anaerolineales bacterium]|jgi:ABC-type lipoprotein release transport system permease subunit
MIQLFKMAFRDLGRNRRRSFFSSLALALGLALLLLMAAFIHGEMSSAIDATIRLQSGHLQVRAKTYDESKNSLKWEDLVENPAQVAAKIASLAPVKVATPRLFASGIVSFGNESSGVRIFGIDPGSAANAPYRAGMISGEFLTADDRQGILIGQALADKLGLKTGDQVSLSVNTSNGDVAGQVFTIRGIYSTQTNGFDSTTVFMPLAKAQAITQTENHASTIFILLKDAAQTDSVAAALRTSQYQVLTWTQMNELILQTEDMANSYMVIFYLIILGVTATVIINTLVMAVFERTREIGILSAIGMKSHRILAMFLAESSLIAVGGILMGLVLGGLVVAYFARYGFYIGNMGVTGILIGNTIYTDLTLNDTVTLTITAFVVSLLAGLYPAIMAARMEPVEALHG